jgi:iron complex transport system ATP-binding protein
MDGPVVSLRNVSVVKGGARLLDRIDWEIGPGDRWVLFGPNGSGKTTLMEVLSSYLFPTAGTVHLFGKRLGAADVRDLRPRIGYVGSAPARFVRPATRVIDLVVTGLHASFFATRWHTYAETDWDRAGECLDALGAGHLTERRFATLSEGERKRVLIARSLMPAPQLLLLDEPGAGLDLGARESLVESLASLAMAPVESPVVLITHHVEEIPPGFDRMMMLSHGRMVASGLLAEVLTPVALSRAFDMDLQVERSGSRWRAWSAGGGGE